MKALYALYAEPRSAQRAIEALRRSGPEVGFDAGQIVVISGEPLESPALAGAQRKTPQYALAALGGLLGGIGGYWLISYTQRSYPISTGAMSIVPLWANGVIIYECAMLAAIVTTVLVLLFGARLPKRKAPLSDPEVWYGKILVGVTDPPANSRSRLETLLSQAGAREVKEFPLPGS
jgi:Alternative complex III, ActD subunit